VAPFLVWAISAALRPKAAAGRRERQLEKIERSGMSEFARQTDPTFVAAVRSAQLGAAREPCPGLGQGRQSLAQSSHLFRPNATNLASCVGSASGPWIANGMSCWPPTCRCRGAFCCEAVRAQYNNLVVDAALRSPSVREVGSTEAQFNPTVIHFIKLCARYLTLRVYQIIETA
jgi:hypothetical protein